MKFVIIGLGSFGASLAIKLTQSGNEVIGIDNNMQKVDALKDKISHTIRLDATDPFAVAGLPLKDTDIVIVAIGEDQGANIIATAAMRNLHVKRLISRAISPLQENVLHAMGIEEIVHPEEETAERWAKKLNLKGLIDSFEINEDYSIVEVNVPDWCVGRTLGEIGFRRNFNLLVMTTLKVNEELTRLGSKRKIVTVQGVASSATVLQEGDIMVIYGDNRDLKKLLDYA
jgi:trk system potassium uptake protein TrkA